MPDQLLDVPWGKEKLSLSLPAYWDLLGVMEPSSAATPVHPGEEVKKSLAVPIGTPPLSEMVRPGMKIALVIDDESRPTPVALLVPAILSELQRGGVKPDQVTVIPALGVHQPMTEAAVARRVGGTAFSSLRWESHDCDSAEKLLSLGVTQRGTPVYINKTVAQADLIVSVGCIEPHIIAGFGGGYKNLVPGVAGRATIALNHSLNCRPDTFNSVGQPLDSNPMRMDLEQAASMIKSPVFIVNTVLNSALEIVRIVCGHPVQAHRQGIQTSAGIYGAAIPSLADVVITSSHPMGKSAR
jgi:nickel-dependent lactate racemase